MIKKKKIIVSVTSLCAAMVLIPAGRVVWFRNYPMDRITGRVVLNVNGESCALNDDNIISRKNIDFTKEAAVTPNEDGSADIAIRGGNYGAYNFSITSGQLNEKTVGVRCFQPNWWNVTEFEIDIDADTEKNVVNYSGWYTYIDEMGFRHKDDISAEKPLNDENNGVSFGMN